MEPPGFNLFVAGPTGTGRVRATRGFVERAARTRPPAPDLCYVNNFDELRCPDGDDSAGEGQQPPVVQELVALGREHLFDRYRVNVVVDNGALQGAPVVFEANPTYYNLLGRIQYQVRFGSIATDFRMIEAGALHRANGGYLVVQALDLLTSPFAWDALKRALRTREVRIENMGEQLMPIPTATLRPDPVPLDAKVS